MEESKNFRWSAPCVSRCGVLVRGNDESWRGLCLHASHFRQSRGKAHLTTWSLPYDSKVSFPPQPMATHQARSSTSSSHTLLPINRSSRSRLCNIPRHISESACGIASQGPTSIWNSNRRPPRTRCHRTCMIRGRVSTALQLSLVSIMGLGLGGKSTVAKGRENGIPNIPSAHRETRHHRSFTVRSIVPNKHHCKSQQSATLA